MTTVELNPTPVGETAPRNGEPLSAYAITYPAAIGPGLCSRITTVTRDLLERRSANRSDHYFLPRLTDALALLGDAAMLRVVEVMMHANARWYGLHVEEWQFKVLRYRAGHWAPPHVDMFPGSMRRKLTLVAQLTPPDVYTGGDLGVQAMGDPWQQLPRGLGTCAVFPAWTRHRVTTITAGERWTLAAWGYGPPVR